MKKIVLLGAGGHAKVIIDIIRSVNDYQITGITSKDNGKSKVYDIPIIGSDDLLKGCKESGVEYAFIALGALADRQIRNKLFDMLKDLGFKIPNLIHKTAIVSPHVSIGEGTCVMPGAIINSGAVIEHDCVIGDNTHISPNVSIAGGVKIGNDTHLGIGSTVIESLCIGCNVTIGAGSVVIHNIKSNVVAVGIPAKIIKEII